MRPKKVGNRVPDGVGRRGQTVTIRGKEIKPAGRGRVIVEADHTVHDGAFPDSAARAQMRDIRKTEPSATIVFTDVDRPEAPPVIYWPGTQPPRPGPLPPGQPPIVPFPDP